MGEGPDGAESSCIFWKLCVMPLGSPVWEPWEISPSGHASGFVQANIVTFCCPSMGSPRSAWTGHSRLTPPGQRPGSRIWDQTEGAGSPCWGQTRVERMRPSKPPLRYSHPGFLHPLMCIWAYSTWTQVIAIFFASCVSTKMAVSVHGTQIF